MLVTISGLRLLSFRPWSVVVLPVALAASYVIRVFSRSSLISLAASVGVLMAIFSALYLTRSHRRPTQFVAKSPGFDSCPTTPFTRSFSG